ncbi:septal ring lytic transglycosylase RlpA family protein [Mesorhizobium sp. LHD-90]|uniref:septal ring lytic transglycosylase RlpA family protein n=1 Tax=Mesorhizobium sp. LHD-90 TaxID=3071414 RepID=UPI0027DF5542|nr:septal ring lytic transglycosylase RlpA family protein [Mesorhizobium sp. LHD-90]MDQ6438041.1 septal ring lytic transglycosylase RlpA family protein [Mesorhizobium sp. LHD-90]
MAVLARPRLRRATSVAVVALCAGFLAACASEQSKSMVAPKSRSKEYFAESIWGVKASPRVSNKKSNLPRGGGRDQTGRPYKVRGKMYYPKEDKNYKKTGYASWYGDAFHGRLTANGEIYDMTHLTAAHPTMPLPSYARVTNVANGSSVIVRVNDRGPYSNGRLIDLSKKAADMLDYTHHGTAQVKVEYVGRAPLDGRDDQYLMASYRPGNQAPDPSDGLPSGVMVAMNGSTPGSGAIGEATAVAFPGTLSDVAPGAEPVMTAAVSSSGDIVLPAFGPIAPERPSIENIIQTQMAMASMSYAPKDRNAAASAFDALEGTRVSAEHAASWKRPAAADQPAGEPFVAAGTFEDKAEAERVRQALADFGRTTFEASSADGHAIYSINLYEDGRNSLDDMLEAAWANGAPDAIAVRD